MNTPLPCPFCDQPGEIVHKDAKGIPIAWVECETCNASGPTADGKQAVVEAVRLWNLALRKTPAGE